jgi:hypothetical protein
LKVIALPANTKVPRPFDIVQAVLSFTINAFTQEATMIIDWAYLRKG